VDGATEGPNNERRGNCMKRNGIASDNLLLQAAALPQDEFVTGHGRHFASIPPQALLERVLERPNLQRALKQVRQNKGAPGIDGMSVDKLPRHLKEHWLEIRAQLVAGSYRPQPVKRVEIPKPDGKKRPLGIPTVVDRFRKPSHRANHQRRMGTPLPPQQLRVPPRTLGASGRAASTGGHPRRICLGGGHRHGSVL
jgi:hypothetical protein